MFSTFSFCTSSDFTIKYPKNHISDMHFAIRLISWGIELFVCVCVPVGECGWGLSCWIINSVIRVSHLASLCYFKCLEHIKQGSVQVSLLVGNSTIGWKGRRRWSWTLKIEILAQRLMRTLVPISVKCNNNDDLKGLQGFYGMLFIKRPVGLHMDLSRYSRAIVFFLCRNSWHIHHLMLWTAL